MTQNYSAGRTKRTSDRFVIGAYDLDRLSGGPEEGGWWFNTGQLIRTISIHRDEDKAQAECRRRNAIIKNLQAGDYRKDIYSAAYSGGAISFEVHTNTLPESFPAERPRFE